MPLSPQTLVATSPGIEGFDVSADGRRFMTVVPKSDPTLASSGFVVMLNGNSLLP